MLEPHDHRKQLLRAPPMGELSRCHCHRAVPSDGPLTPFSASADLLRPLLVLCAGAGALRSLQLSPWVPSRCWCPLCPGLVLQVS